MKILLSKKAAAQDDCNYLLIDTFDKFIALSSDDIDQTEEIKMVDFLLSMSCLYWLVDNDLPAVARINFVLTITDKERCEALRLSIHQYVNKYHYLKRNEVNVPYEDM